MGMMSETKKMTRFDIGIEGQLLQQRTVLKDDGKSGSISQQLSIFQAQRRESRIVTENEGQFFPISHQTRQFKALQATAGKEIEAQLAALQLQSSHTLVACLERLERRQHGAQVDDFLDAEWAEADIEM